MYLEKFRLDGKTAIVTGGSRGIGREIALALSEAGANVTVASRKLEALKEVVAEIEADGGKGHAVSAHAGNLEALESIVNETVEKFGSVDILVNNAAINPKFGPVEDMDEALFNKMIDVNLKAYLFLSKMVLGPMEKAGGGSIINISSIEAFSPSFGTGVYNITKASVVMLTKVLAKEWASKNIRVNTIAPGLIKTHFSEMLWSADEILKIYLNHCPMGRIGEAYEVAGLALFLASNASSYTTGTILTADGGYLL
ncbi:MAG: glucose 1-dehydrogenase [Deltaproteobacteria bacterium]|uniref:Glucose 1-dehydrogenase n=1 Tax=Candidatus Zymogenus saltonus TaxID=2844893 RepID=A0A9D8KC22_9DELT|nr:glucose 1-dehydrogenase [Candidatus Zymogenus saltonus]